MLIDEFEKVCATQPYQRKGMFYSEVFIFLQSCNRLGVRQIIESGVKYGMSTRLISAVFTGDFISIEKNPVVEIPGVEQVRGDSLQLLPSLVKTYRSCGVGVLIDGPKGLTAIRLKDACLKAGAMVVAVHDQEPGHGETKHTQQFEFRRITERLNRFVSDEYRAKYPIGSGLAIWERTQ